MVIDMLNLMLQIIYNRLMNDKWIQTLNIDHPNLINELTFPEKEIFHFKEKEKENLPDLIIDIVFLNK